MAQKGIEDANDILAPTDNKRDLKARARLVYGNRCEASQATLGSLQPPLPPNLGRPAASLPPPPSLGLSLSLLSKACTPHSLAFRRASRACHATTPAPPTLARPPHRHRRGTILTPEDRPSSRGKSEEAARGKDLTALVSAV